MTIILRKDGKIVCGRTSYVDGLNSGKEKAFDFDEYGLPEYDSYEMYAHDWM
ncbi:hypothetical protein [Ruminococcus sp. NK3A76]|uniref:hypothetical protein n=1 Tax=Ruminococcus sp. NK3A76 TaxID=877411 RepID=UPI0018DE9D34|nr:hypothetical protein [Ruminococcus sp. NK3A76]